MTSTGPARQLGRRSRCRCHAGTRFVLQPLELSQLLVPEAAFDLFGALIWTSDT
jgi:hypothetical protein